MVYYYLSIPQGYARTNTERKKRGGVKLPLKLSLYRASSASDELSAASAAVIPN